MVINKATVTGADDYTAISDIEALSKEFPQAEWGILIGSHAGTERFPSSGWIEQLIGSPNPLQLSAHLCGSPLRHLINGEMPQVNARFQRAQLNWHGIKAHPKPAMYDRLKECHLQWIFQLDGVNDDLLTTAIEAGVNCAAIFDQSHGAGVVPDHWPVRRRDVLCTYAGGLNPDCISHQLAEINVAATGPICIDIETWVRSQAPGGLTVLDIDRVRTYLKAAGLYREAA